MKSQKQRSAKIKRLDKLCAKIVRGRAGGRCEVCRGQGIESHHARGKGTNVLRYYTPGCVWVCRDCHDYLGRNPKASRQIIINRAGDQMWDYLGQLRYETGTTLEAVEESLKEKHD